jgi:hypothetical protein
VKRALAMVALLAGCASTGTVTAVEPAAALALDTEVYATVSMVVVSDDVPRDRFGTQSWLAVRVTVTNLGDRAFPLDLRDAALHFEDAALVLPAFATVAGLSGGSALVSVPRQTFSAPAIIIAGGQGEQWVLFAGFEPGPQPARLRRITLELGSDGERHRLPIAGPAPLGERWWRVTRQPYGATHAGLAMVAAPGPGRAVGAPVAGASVAFWHLRLDAELGPALRWEPAAGARLGGALGALGLAASPGLALGRWARLAPYLGLRYAFLDAGERPAPASADGIGPEVGLSLALGAESSPARSPFPLTVAPRLLPPRLIVKAAYVHDWPLAGGRAARPGLSLTVAFALWP